MEQHVTLDILAILPMRAIGIRKLAARVVRQVAVAVMVILLGITV